MHVVMPTYSAVVGLVLCGSAAMAIETKPTLTLDLTKKIAAGCEAKAKQENWKMNIAVVNDGTRLVYFEHMDGAFLGSIYISQQKAISHLVSPNRATRPRVDNAYRSRRKAARSQSRALGDPSGAPRRRALASWSGDALDRRREGRTGARPRRKG
jgi:Haem-degrading